MSVISTKDFLLPDLVVWLLRGNDDFRGRARKKIRNRLFVTGHVSGVPTREISADRGTPKPRLDRPKHVGIYILTESNIAVMA